MNLGIIMFVFSVLGYCYYLEVVVYIDRSKIKILSLEYLKESKCN